MTGVRISRKWYRRAVSWIRDSSACHCSISPGSRSVIPWWVVNVVLLIRDVPVVSICGMTFPVTIPAAVSAVFPETISVAVSAAIPVTIPVKFFLFLFEEHADRSKIRESWQNYFTCGAYQTAVLVSALVSGLISRLKPALTSHHITSHLISSHLISSHLISSYHMLPVNGGDQSRLLRVSDAADCRMKS